MFGIVLEWLTFPPGWPVAAVAGVALTVGVGVLVARFRALADTTLVPAWGWALAAILAIGAVQIGLSLLPAVPPAVRVPLELAAAALSFCPVIALLGAMRPQHNYWNFIVFSAWVMLALPAAETYFMNRGQRPEIGDARAWFLWIMILLGPVNFLVTRFALAALLLAGGQFVLFSEHLPLVRQPIGGTSQALGLMLLSAALVAAYVAARRDRATANPYDRLWLSFRDTFGMLWGLRFAERVNAAAGMYGWSFQLTWIGLCGGEGEEITNFDPAVEQQLRATLRGLLRRFLSPAGIAHQLGRDID